MAPRSQNQSFSSAAEDMVFDNLGLSRDELGIGDTGADDGDDSEQGDLDGFVEPGDDDRSDVRRTRQDDGGGDDDDQLDDLRQRPDPRRRQQREDDITLDDLRSVTHTGDGRQPFARTGEVRPDKQGNLVNAQGQVVARRGREARLYQSAFKAGQGKQNSGMQYQLNEANTNLERVTELARRAVGEVERHRASQARLREFGLTPEKQLEAFQLYSSFQKDPKRALRTLLTKAHANGITMEQITNPTGGGLDATELVGALKEALQPVLAPIAERTTAEQRREQEQRQRQDSEAQAQREVDGFFAANPDAVRYTPVFRKMMGDPEFANMSLGEMWTRIQLHFARNPRRQNPRDRRGPGSPPRGRGNPPESRNGTMAPVTQSYDSIAREVLAEQGIR